MNDKPAEEDGVSQAVVEVPREIWETMVEHARRDQPEECCGVLGGSDGALTACYPLRNAADRPETRYFATPEDLFAAMRKMRDANQTLAGIYHSHPRTPAYPSPTDVELAFYSEAIYFIISLEPELDVRAYRIEHSQISHLSLVIGH